MSFSVLSMFHYAKKKRIKTGPSERTQTHTRGRVSLIKTMCVVPTKMSDV